MGCSNNIESGKVTCKDKDVVMKEPLMSVVVPMYNTKEKFCHGFIAFALRVLIS